MKLKVLKISAIILLYSLLGAGCEKNEDEWTTIESLTPDISIKTQFDLIFSDDNECLIGFQTDTVYDIFYSQAELEKIDTCNIVPIVDFEKYSLIAGKVMVPGMISNISDITLTYCDSKDSYKLEVFIDECEECYDAIGYLFFWRLYPKVKTEYNFNVFIGKN
jgi:hypothetical protein